MSQRNEICFSQKVYDLLLMIPKGKVTTYSKIAKALGNKNLARAVGNALHNNPDKYRYPCYKVVNSLGKLSKRFAFGGISAQADLLRTEGIVVDCDKVDLSIYLFEF